jgi:hypothetical protein
VSDSYPPHLLRLPGSAPGSPRRGDLEQPVASPLPAAPAPTAGSQQDASPFLLAAPGTPGTYDPPATPQDRPRNITELRERVQPATPEPWPAGAYVQIGESGRHAHWTGSDWRLKESPGYPAGELVGAVRSVPEQTT